MARLLVLLFGLVVALPARAATVAGVTLPNAYPVDGRTLVLNGIGLRTVTIFSIHAYVAGLYVPQRSHDARAILAAPGPKVVLMYFLHEASKSRVESEYRKGEARNCARGECRKSDEADFERLIAATPPAAVGDTLTYVIDGASLRVLANNRLVARFDNRDLASRILAGFIGDHPPSEDLRAHLLGTQ